MSRTRLRTRLSSGGGVAFDATTVTLLARFTTPPTGGQQIAINSFIVEGKASGWWALTEWVYIPRFGDNADSLLNWKSTNYTLTKSGTLTFSAAGVAGDAAASYLDTGFGPSAVAGQFAQDSHSMAVYTATVSDAVIIEIGQTNFSISCNNGSALGARSSSASADSTTTATSAGVSGFNRNNSANFDITRNGAVLANQARASSALTSANIWVCARNNNGVISAPSGRVIGCAQAGAALTTGQILSRDTAIATLMASL